MTALRDITATAREFTVVIPDNHPGGPIAAVAEAIAGIESGAALHGSHVNAWHDWRHTLARQFLARLDPEADQFTFQSFDDTPAKRRDLARVMHGDFDRLADTLDGLNGWRAGVFVTVNATDGKGRQAHNVERVRAVFVDLDGAPLAPVLAAELEPHVVCESSPGRFHAYWLTDDCPLDQFERVQRALARRFGGDPSVHDLPRVMRLPGFRHFKRGAQTCKLLDGIGTTAPPYALAEIVGGLGLELDAQARPLARPNGDGGAIEPGSRHGHLFASGRSMAKRGLSPEAVRAALAAENQARCNPPVAEADIDDLARRAFEAKDAQGWQDAPPRGATGADGSAYHRADDRAAEDEPRPPDEPQNLFDSQAPSALDLRAALPSVLADFAAVRAGVAGHDPTAYAYAAIGAASGVIPHATRIEIAPTWREPLLQFVALVGVTGSAKSPAMNAAVEPVIALHRMTQDTYKRDLAAWKAAKGEGEAPARSGYYFTDPSIEALIDRAANASHTILRHADEGTAWLNAMGRYSTRGDSGERGIWLAGWNGMPYTVTRIERGDKSLDAWGVAVLYGITPGKLKEAYADAASDGMLARTLICLTDAARWIAAHSDPNAATVTERYTQAVDAAAKAERTLTLSARAADRWQALRTDYRATAQAVAEIAPGLSGFLVKAPTMAARLAGLFALLEGAATATDGSMERAEAFIRHAAGTARIAHEQVFAVAQPVAIARRLAARILTSAGYRITRREFMRTDAFAKATEPERGAAIEHLAAAGWLLEADGKRVRLGPRFREATGWRVNPLVHERFADIAERERHAAQDALARLNRLCGAAA